MVEKNMCWILNVREFISDTYDGLLIKRLTIHDFNFNDSLTIILNKSIIKKENQQSLKRAAIGIFPIKSITKNVLLNNKINNKQ